MTMKIRYMSRRRALQGVSAMVGMTALGGCGDDGASGTGEGTSSTGSGTSGGTEGGTAGTTGEDASGSTTGAPVGSQCSEVSDLSPEQLLAPIETIVVVMMENRSFDHFFGALSLEEGKMVDGLTGTESNPDDAGNPVSVFPSDYYVVEEDPPHGWDASHLQWNDGANDGFVTEHLAEGAQIGEVVMGYHTREQLPILYALADDYVLCERWFASVMGPTWPNRLHLHLATSGGETSNTGVSGYPSIFDRLTDAGVDSRYYSSNLPFTATYGRTEGVEQVEKFFEAAAAGTLPPFCMVEPMFTFGGTIGNDDHPPADIRMGQAFLATVYQALAQSPQWDRCLLIITYDEHGGFYDHVSPPTTFDDQFPEFQQLGFRVPSLVVGPHVRRGCVSSVQLDHVSIPATVTRRFGLEPLNERVTQTEDLSHAIDPLFIDDPQPPVELPPVPIELPPSGSFLDPDQKLGQEDLCKLLDRGDFPPELDRRAEHDQVMHRLLEIGERLGAVKIVKR